MIINNCDSYYNFNPSFQGWRESLAARMAKLKQKAFDIIPETTSKKLGENSERIQKVTDVISSPVGNRAIMGVTALAMQPPIDFYNKKVDEDTRKVARNRTIAKIIAGTSVGIAVRSFCYKGIGMLADPQGVKKYSKLLLPKAKIADMIKHPERLTNYKNALSMIIALVVMMFTNFLLDAPLTTYFTNKLNARSNLGGVDE